MKNRAILCIMACALFISVLTGCSGQIPATVIVEVTQPPAPTSIAATITSTPDMCAPNNVTKEVQKVHDLMREFDDINFIANVTPQQNLSPLILELLGVRRKAESVEVAVCVTALQVSAVNYMNVVISYLANFMGGSERDAINQQITSSQNLRIVYEAELARLIGATYIPPATITPAPTSETQETPTAAVPAVTGPEVIAKNVGNTPANLRDAPSFEALKVGELAIGDSARALARTPAGDWILIQFPGVPNNLAWVYSNLVQLDAPFSDLPVVAPAPTATPSS